MTAAVAAIASACGLAVLAGWLLSRRSGALRATSPRSGEPFDLQATGLDFSGTGPTVVHFSAPWCGPCARVRQVVSEVCDGLGNVAHVEVDLESNAALAQHFSVLSLPTTLIFDDEGRQRYRAAGVPSAADLRSALTPLLA
ncbi:thioredoxin family protein [Mycobacterium xenopi]|uniref:Thiol reductase thioredoxin n=1 Tax=Mycobacterium xenopi TaxID=1789 RepID=A0AAD1GYA2_MYCXE|nr:thioredoxin family protein [Mycobacterium xenopi]EID09192.1 thioredoxin [Mycobacterium xenopi RIVM700367]MDA3641858.1 thioredoxin family protein [Mycobacterium xenopi]MDA3659477.1 thioredoxin family protein [Mycobacterium xenopi]MDA3664132.1 thioredoxin family protein [Mycobacterium xenopi]ORX11394.1 thioredoxin [Mycobacterium xenopi]